MNPVVRTVVEFNIQVGDVPPVILTDKSVKLEPLAIAVKLKLYCAGARADVKLVTCAPPAPEVPVTT